MTVTVADLRGHALGAAEAEIPALTPQTVERLADADQRRQLARRLYDDALASAGLDPAKVLAVS